LKGVTDQSTSVIGNTIAVAPEVRKSKIKRAGKTPPSGRRVIKKRRTSASSQETGGLKEWSKKVPEVTRLPPVDRKISRIHTCLGGKFKGPKERGGHVKRTPVRPYGNLTSMTKITWERRSRVRPTGYSKLVNRDPEGDPVTSMRQKSPGKDFTGGNGRRFFSGF